MHHDRRTLRDKLPSHFARPVAALAEAWGATIRGARSCLGNDNAQQSTRSCNISLGPKLQSLGDPTPLGLIDILLGPSPQSHGDLVGVIVGNLGIQGLFWKYMWAINAKTLHRWSGKPTSQGFLLKPKPVFTKPRKSFY